MALPSRASNPSAVIPQELKDAFSWNPPQLEPLPDKKMSKHTRPPGLFDKHFRKELKLLHVKRLPSLVHDIAAIVDKTIESFNGSVQFPPSKEFFSADDIHLIANILDENMADEKAVASFYDKTTATFCVPVASTLALRVPGVVMWTQSVNVSGYAIADGFLKFAGPKALNKRITKLREVLDKETFEIFLRLAKRGSSLSTYEIKNLAADGIEVMLAIPNLSNLPKFVWTSCDYPTCASDTKHEMERIKSTVLIPGLDAKSTPWTFDSCSNSYLEDREKVVQPQPSQPQPIALASTSAQLPDYVTSEVKKRKRDDRSNNQSMANLPLSHLPTSLSPTTFQGTVLRRSPRLASTTTPLPSPPTIKKTKKQVQGDLTNVTRSTSLMPPPLLPIRGVEVKAAFLGQQQKGKGKEVIEDIIQAGGNDEDGERNHLPVDDPSYEDQNDLSARFIVQQAWAQATRADCSIIVIHSGNHEFIGVRRRSDQTLYISDLVEPYACKEPSYGKLHVGIYVAAIKDAIDQERQVHDGRSPDDSNGPPGDDGGDGGGDRGNPNGGDPDNGDSGNHGDDHGGHKQDGRMGQKEGSGGAKGEDSMKPEGGGGGPIEGGNQRRRAIKSIAKGVMAATNEKAKKNALELASTRNVVLLYLQYGVYDSSAPSTFVRCDPTGQAPNPLPSRETVRNYRLDECLTIVLKSEIGQGATGEVLRGTLEVEASESACLPLDVAVKLAFTTEGLFALRNEYETYRRLKSRGVTTGITTPLGLFYDVEGGTSGLVMPYEGISLAEMPEFVLPISSQEAVLAILADIHHAHVLHGDLRLANILLADSGFMIIDFGRSRVCKDQDAKNREISRLRSLFQRAKVEQAAKRPVPSPKC